MIKKSSLLLFLLFIFTNTIFAETNYQLVDRIVAIVDDDVIVASELSKSIAETRSKLKALGSSMPSEIEIRDKALERLILAKLQLKAAQKLGINIDEESVSKAVATIARRNKMSLLDMQKALAADGINFTIFRNTIKEKIILGQLRNKAVLSRIKITKGEIDNFLANEGGQLSRRQEFLLQHILISKPEGATPSEIETIKEKLSAIKSIINSDNFSQLAKKYSDGRQATEGGLLGWRKVDELPSLFIKPASLMERGEIKGPIASGDNFHFIKLVDYKGGDRHIVAQTHARHILLRPNEQLSDNNAKTRLEQLRERIVNGADFANLARSNSDDQGSAIRGGDLKWLNPGDTVPAFEKVMNSLAIDEVSQPFKSTFGWHIIQVLGRKDADQTDLAIRQKAKIILVERKGDDAMQNYLQRLRDEAYIDVRLKNSFE